MIVVSLFWFATLILLLAAVCFIVPPIWLTSNKALQFSNRDQTIYSLLLVLLLVICSYYVYVNLGSSHKLAAYYSHENKDQQQNYKLIRPLYARLQRAMLKNQLDLKLDLDSVDLILNFAQLHSKAQNGVLQPEVHQLLQAVLKTLPQQITALNLIAVDAYKTKQYALAIDCWQKILLQFTPEMRNTDIEKTLLDQIAKTRLKLQRA